MTAEDRVRWDKIYRQSQTPYPDPDPFLLQFTPAVLEDESKSALDLAGGLGQNGLWLAQQGYETDIMDISRAALERARSEMAMRNLRNANLLQVDIDGLRLPAQSYDLICVFRYLKPHLFDQIRKALKIGGRVIYETYNVDYLELVPKFNPAYLLEHKALERYFFGWHQIFSETDRHISRIVAVKKQEN
ncbi:hypothetical protein MASR2M15_27320 [Anaerolineales bacterium]